MSFAPEVAFHLTSPNDFFSDNSQSVLMFDLLTVLPMEGLCSRLTLKLTGKTDQPSSFSDRDWSKYFSNIFAVERLSLCRRLPVELSPVCLGARIMGFATSFPWGRRGGCLGSGDLWICCASQTVSELKTMKAMVRQTDFSLFLTLIISLVSKRNNSNKRFRFRKDQNIPRFYFEVKTTNRQLKSRS